MEFLIIILIVVVVFMAVYIMMQRMGGSALKKYDANTDNLKKHFGDDYSKIIGGGNTSVPKPVTRMNFTPVTLSSVSGGNGAVHAAINRKISGAGFLGISIVVADPKTVPAEAGEDFCSLVSSMLAKAIGACAKNDGKYINIAFTPDESNMSVSVTYPTAEPSEPDKVIDAVTEKLGGTRTAETQNGTVTDTVNVPINSI